MTYGCVGSGFGGFGVVVRRVEDRGGSSVVIGGEEVLKDVVICSMLVYSFDFLLFFF